jgi:hypothetical protein
MLPNKDIAVFFDQGFKEFIPQLSIDCAIFGYHKYQLRVLLLRWKDVDGWCLPGGYISHKESIDEAAKHILYESTGLDRVFLRQYHTFGDLGRNSTFEDPVLKSSWFYKYARGSWLDNRTISIGYYALVDFSEAIPKPDEGSSDSTWWHLHALPSLLFDHADMIVKALGTLKTQIKYQPVGLNLLPKQFTLTELQKLYETILERKLDRRNFQKKILTLDILTRLDQRRNIGPHRSPNLYSFDAEKYNKALAEGNGLVC